MTGGRCDTIPRPMLPTAPYRLTLSLALVLPLAAGAQPAESPACGLVDVAAEAGLDFVHDRGTSPRKHLAETMGAGVAWLDYDGDGWQDLYVVQSGPFPPDGSAGAANRLYRNLGPGAGGVPRFEDVTGRAGVGDRGYGMGATPADVDGDGDLDLYVTNYGDDVFYRNRGDGTFEDATAAAGLATAGWSSSAAFADADLDGDLDLYVARYVLFPIDHDPFCGDPETGERRYCDPAMFEGANDVFYRNRGPGEGLGTFEDATAAAGLSGANGRGLGVLFVDLDDDGAPDLYVANDETINFLFRNRSADGDGEAAGAFEDLSLLSGTAVNADGKPEAGMGLLAADFDTDGDPDLAVTNFDVETNTYYENLTESPGAMQFADRSAPNGFGVPSFNFLGFGIVPADLDGDGDLDVYVANGHIFERPGRPEIGYAQRDQVLLGDGRGRFVELRCPVLEASPRVGRGLAAADADRDGDPDLAVSNNGGPLQLLASDLPGLAGGAIAVEAGVPGAVVTLEVADGDGGSERRTRWVTAGDSYQSASAPTVLFALGPGETARAVEVRWPDGAVTRVAEPPAGRSLRLDP